MCISGVMMKSEKLHNLVSPGLKSSHPLERREGKKRDTGNEVKECKEKGSSNQLLTNRWCKNL